MGEDTIILQFNPKKNPVIDQNSCKACHIISDTVLGCQSFRGDAELCFLPILNAAVISNNNLSFTGFMKGLQPGEAN